MPSSLTKAELCSQSHVSVGFPSDMQVDVRVVGAHWFHGRWLGFAKQAGAPDLLWGRHGLPALKTMLKFFLKVEVYFVGNVYWTGRANCHK